MSVRMVSRMRWAASEIRRQWTLVRSFNLSPTDLVLDVGSGQNPNLRADVLCDRFLTDHSERACGGSPVVDRPLVVADAERLPFRSQAFDFVVCSHLLEHVRRPQDLLAELQRVARRGYIETPSSVHERLYGNAFHKWLVSREGDTLRLTPKPTAVFSDDLSHWFRAQYEGNPRFQSLVNHNLADLGLLVRHYWETRIRFEIEGEIPEDGSFVFARSDRPGDGSYRPRTLGQKLRSLLGFWLRRRSSPDMGKLLGLLACTCCRGSLRLDHGALLCPSGHRFPVCGSVFYLSDEFEGQL